MTALSRPSKEDRLALPLSRPLSSRRSMVCRLWLCTRRQCLKLLNFWRLLFPPIYLHGHFPSLWPVQGSIPTGVCLLILLSVTLSIVQGHTNVKQIFCCCFLIVLTRLCWNCVHSLIHRVDHEQTTIFDFRLDSKLTGVFLDLTDTLTLTFGVVEQCLSNFARF